MEALIEKIELHVEVIVENEEGAVQSISCFDISNVFRREVGHGRTDNRVSIQNRFLCSPSFLQRLVVSSDPSNRINRNLAERLQEVPFAHQEVMNRLNVFSLSSYRLIEDSLLLRNAIILS